MGVGGVVLNERDEILVIVERSSHFHHKSYKIPGGLVDPRERLQEAAVREVWEETGIRTEFRSVIAMRHKDDYTFGFSDLYIVCRLEPADKSQLIPKKQEEEVARVEWLPLDKYLADDSVSSLHKAIARSTFKLQQNKCQHKHARTHPP